ncbi:MAG TPA: universal stress protein, partial [Ramlibacter sp.]|nr:universal stress protein [Ramlibacter sp.]
MPIESILVVTDFSSESDIAVDRASRLAQAHDAALTLMYAPAGPMPAALDPGKRLAAIARQLEARLALRVATVSRVAGTLQGVAQEAARHDLLVFPARTER